MEFKGLLRTKLGEREGTSANGTWKRATYLLEQQTLYAKRLVVEVSDGLSGRIAEFDKYIGEQVLVQFDINAVQWNDKWFNNVTAYRVEPTSVATGQAETTTAVVQENTTAQVPNNDEPPF